MLPIVFILQFAAASAGAFLAHLPLNMTRNTSDPEFKKALLDELEVLGADLSSSTKKRVDQIEDALRPMFTAMPKNHYGKLSHDSVKYILRRLFIHRQGWVIEGLEPTGEKLDPTTASPILEDRAPEMVREVLNRHIGTRGSGLHELAVIGAMMEHLIFEDMLGRLQQAYTAKRISPDELVTSSKAQDLISLHMASFIRARDVSGWTVKQVNNFQRLIYTLYPHWDAIVPLMREVQEQVAPNLEQLSFDDVARVAVEIHNKFASWQHEMCDNTLAHLLEIEEGSTGRVRLVDFYDAALHKGRYQFTETITYLRHLGTLDETDELNPRVIIPNYVIGRSNCIARTGYYSVCCLDKCESLFGDLEHKLSTDSSTPGDIISAMENEASPFAGERSSLLRRRLDEIATHHGGFIPLHGRLFAQWMHLAYPHDCAYPHKSGTVYYSSMERWEKETGERSGSTIEEIQHWSKHLSEIATKRNVTETRVEEDHLSGMWTMEEELVTAWKPSNAVPSERAYSFALADVDFKRGAVLALVVVGFVFARFVGLAGLKGRRLDKRSVDKWCV